MDITVDEDEEFETFLAEMDEAVRDKFRAREKAVVEQLAKKARTGATPADLAEKLAETQKLVLAFGKQATSGSEGKWRSMPYG